MIAVALWSVAALLALAPAGVVLSTRPRGSIILYGGCLVATSTLCVTALSDLLFFPHLAPSATLPIGLPWLGAHFRLDALSAFFLVVVNLGGAAASLFALGYSRHEDSPGRVLPFYPAYLAAMNVVVLANDAFSFLVAWEFMSLTSWAMAVSHHRDPENVRAGYVYILMASFGTLALLLAFGLLASGAGYDFDAIRASHPSAALTGTVVILVLLGAGSKAGLVPLHAWLPLAHPAAPSHVSALMSGVMTKVAVYGFVRIVFDLVPEPVWWWSMVVLLVGGPTATLGVLYALMQRDIKRVLAYSTIENIGIIFTGLGLALAFKAEGLDWVAALAFTAAMLHVFNHALFKSLLFFGAGAVLGATGERDMEKLGGLIHRMPKTAFAMLVGCVAISALPPFNGFVSEWLTFQAILLSPQLPSWGLKLVIPAVGGLLALAAAFAAACFVKLYGISFLGRPRSDVAASAHETDRFSLTAMFALAAFCLIAGILPGLFIDALAPVSKDMVGNIMPHQVGLQWLTIVPIAESRSSYNGLLVFLFAALCGTAAATAIHRLASDRLRRAPAWDCGYPDADPAIQYSASSFSQPIRRVFGSVIFGAREIGEMPPPSSPLPARLQVELHDLIWDGLYAPIAKAIGFATDRINILQFLSIRRYLTLVFVALVVLLLVVAL
ncbi:formate hydrogenlyase subunit 3/multisubunit Na+/H+ antiporter MnhD subunit [Bradyrhizobium sp. R2.2-H]|jgi:formate hydrogenlyase subunit 3/multisubunit Na+/H+ antiporter MnhD subunit|uniref:hydrogenase 4 subunit B n=1 Tax=unclassified Bradyrhizobium TaxID=2631580 RepID=UPI001052F7C9|nr:MULTISPECIES: hydrogenase 4 subunit B [unclassified Bradyrhizobium]TCU66120.1 formate hydrogenlyase subunit 3/multisubunit Na+/H+ antiporter MnhD subunit [Bradyrhizobium sp. Y-H1]TCU67939.1 formate hydrogenlyase subunit 3/multisubunit Na+/H+ antiporter MnhD subunit [Bradyrhizobium sp. R2.2-H]